MGVAGTLRRWRRGGGDRTLQPLELDLEFDLIAVDLQLELPLQLVGDRELDPVTVEVEFGLGCRAQGLAQPDQALPRLLAGDSDLPLDLHAGHCPTSLLGAGV